MLPDRRRLVLWTSYDFANAIVVMVFVMYFSQWLVVENHVADLWYNMIFVAATILLGFTAPFATVFADRHGRRVWFLRTLTVVQVIFYATAGATASYWENSRLALIVATAAYTLAIYCHQFALSFYNALLPDIATPKHTGSASGLGQFAKWIGTIVGLVVGLIFAKGSLHLLGHAGRSQAFLPATALSCLLTIPSLFLKEPHGNNALHRAGKTNYIGLAKQLLQTPGLGPYLLAFFFFNDAIITVQDNMPIYMQRVMMIGDKTKSIVLAGGLVGAALGGLLGGRLSDKLGLRRTLLICLLIWAIYLPSLSVVTSTAVFGVMVSLMGLLYGTTWSVARAVMSYLAPKDQVSHAFGYYTLAERFSSFAGPLAWGLIVSVFGASGPIRYRVALMTMGVFVGLGLIVAKRIPNDTVLQTADVRAAPDTSAGAARNR